MPAVTAMSVLRHRREGSALVDLEDRWPFATHVAVRTLEEVDRLSRITLAVGGVKRSKLPKPLVIPRPGERLPTPPPKPSQGWIGALMDVADDGGVKVEVA